MADIQSGTLSPSNTTQGFSYTIFQQGGEVFAKNGLTGLIDFSGPSTDAAPVIQAAINALNSNVIQGTIFLKNQNSQFANPFNIKSALNIPTTMSIIGENNTSTAISAAAAMTNMITKSSTVARVEIRDIALICNGNATNGLNLTDAVNGAYNIRIQNVRVNGYSGYGFILDGNEDTNLIGCIAENPAGAGKALKWQTPNGNVWVQHCFFAGDAEVFSQQVIIRDSTISGLRAITGTTLNVKLSSVYFNGVLSSGNAVEGFIQQMAIENCIITLGNGQNVIAGTYTSEITFKHNTMSIGPGNTGVVLPSTPTLTSANFPANSARVRIIDNFVVGGGTVNLVAAGWSPGVILAEVENFNLTLFGNRNLNEAAPGGGAVTKLITLQFPYPDAKYEVVVEPQGNAVVWVTLTTATTFTLNYSVAGGVAVAWYAKHLDT